MTSTIKQSHVSVAIEQIRMAHEAQGDGRLARVDHIREAERAATTRLQAKRTKVEKNYEVARQTERNRQIGAAFGLLAAFVGGAASACPDLKEAASEADSVADSSDLMVKRAQRRADDADAAIERNRKRAENLFGFQQERFDMSDALGKHFW